MRADTQSATKIVRLIKKRKPATKNGKHPVRTTADVCWCSGGLTHAKSSVAVNSQGAWFAAARSQWVFFLRSVGRRCCVKRLETSCQPKPFLIGGRLNAKD